MTGHWEKVRAGQAGRADRRGGARDAGAAIVMPLPRARRRRRVFGKTVETVLAERPCRVIIQADPATDREPTTVRAPAAA